MHGRRPRRPRTRFLLSLAFLAWFAACCVLWVPSARADDAQTAAAGVKAQAEEQLDEVPTQAIDQFWRQLVSEYGGYLPDAQGTNLTRAVLESGGFNVAGLCKGLLRYFLSELFDNARLLGTMLMLSVLAAVLASLQTAFERQTVSQVAYFAVFMVLMVLAIGSFTEAIGYGKHAIQAMVDFMMASVPVLIALLAASGSVASAAFFKPMLMLTVNFVSNVVLLVVFPLIFFAALLDITSALSPRYSLTRLASLLRSGGVFVLGISMSVFLGVSAVQGVGKGVADGVALRAMKFVSSNFIPVVGKSLSDAWETVASASMLVKNAVGIAAVIILACIALFPAVKILALVFVYNGSAALMQPLGDNPMVACLGALAKSLLHVFAAVAVVALMFFLSVCVLLASANLAVVMR
ncbi:stage III sporulation protein AE [Alicyclobacillus cellulosilyticus]|uniref:Stage III sporulation protein AE n=1 Tax=Alicyclobacillus cellulosilyticus TaxID=1003997 RepID=A0A917NFI7_9BACL|nr:stage III sporulation protein AE [Alicyclobacillus cellulosilyticus]GGI95970.1 stage III sporulation protein AE [Alicyclobacillus cellulosilyticus]